MERPGNRNEKIDARECEQLGKFAKIYFYMFPHIWYKSYQMNSIINQIISLI